MLKNFFKKKESKSTNNENILILALLIHAAKIDENYTENEKKIIKKIVIDLEKIDSDQAEELFKLGVYVTGFFYPVVPKGQARIRVQISASHTTEDLKLALSAFKKVGKSLKIID